MRFYTIKISDPVTGEIFVPNYEKQEPAGFQKKPAASGAVTFSSKFNGVTDPNALHIEFDIPSAPFSQPKGSAWLRVFGIGLKQLAQASDLNGKIIEVYAGMAKGLPLAKPAQSGLLARGKIFQGYGNWVGLYQTLEFVFYAAFGSANEPKNIVIDWRSGMQLSEAINSALQIAFPEYSRSIKISDKLVLSHDEPGAHQSLQQFAQYINAVSTSIIGGDYRGVQMVIRDNSFVVYDGTTVTTPKNIEYTDLIGQPTWVGPGLVQLLCVMRADLQVSDYILLPKGPVINTPQSLPNFRNTSAFQGAFQIQNSRGVGAYRHPDAQSWVTVVDAYPTQNISQ